MMKYLNCPATFITIKKNKNKMLKNNKGDITIIFVIIMILTLVLLVALLYPQYNIFIKIGGKAPYDICRNSVDAAALMRFKNIELSPFLKCETQQYIITKNNVEEAKQTIADAMYNCYYQFAQGEKNLFSDEGRFCFVCSTIDFEEQGTKIKELPAFQKYLFENYADSKHTYAQYLYKDKAEQKKERMNKDGTYSKQLPTQKMAVVFTYDKFATDLSALFLKELLLQLSQQQMIDWSGGLLEEYPLEFTGDYTRIGTVMLLSGYNAEKIKKLACTQKIPQKNK